MPRFVVNEKPDPAAFEIHRNPGSKKLFFFFGGLAAGMPVPPYAFYKISQKLDGTRILLRDLDQCWYQLGLRGVSNDIFETADWLIEQQRQSGCEETYFIGNSMGGYAAILYAALTGLGKAIAFAPQTYLSPVLKLRYLNRQFYRHYLRMYRLCVFKPKAWDLRKVLVRSEYEPEITLYYDGNHRSDNTHAEHLAGIAHVRIEKVNMGGHGLVRNLNREGRLLSILEEECR